jgi:D-sedoheptulose 7-phosphate isomerase
VTDHVRREVTDMLTYAHVSSLARTLEPFREEAGKLRGWGETLADRLDGGGRVLVAGNGGSAAEAQHLVAELVGKMGRDRRPLSAIALPADTASLTAIGNDYGYPEVFARQVHAHGRPGDILITLSTSGKSRNLLEAMAAAAEVGMLRWALTGLRPNPLASASDDTVAVPSPDPQTVQELHLVSVHLLCAHVDAALPARPPAPRRHLRLERSPL